MTNTESRSHWIRTHTREEIASMISVANIREHMDHGDLTGWCERIRGFIRNCENPSPQPKSILPWVEGTYVSTDDDNGPMEGIPVNLKASRAGTYTIIRQRREDGLFLLRGRLTFGTSVFARLEDAQAAAQADYDSTLPPQEHGPGFQNRVAAAHHALFHDDPTDVAERVARFFEEAAETCQALGMTHYDADKLLSYTFGRPVGDPAKEIGAAKLTLASLCVVAGYDMDACGEADLEKLQRPETIARIRAKRSTRHGRGPLPGIDPAASSMLQSAETIRQINDREPVDEWVSRAATEGSADV